MTPLRFISGMCALLCLLAWPTAYGTPVQASARGACLVDTEILVLPACALETRHDQLFVARRFLPQLFAGESGSLVAVNLPVGGWSYVDRSGKVVVRHVAIMDNFANAFHFGLVRVNDGGKWGLADSHGRLVVPLRYDGMLDYQPGAGWRACTGCRNVNGGEYSRFEGGQWVSLDRYGKLARARQGSKPAP